MPFMQDFAPWSTLVVKQVIDNLHALFAKFDPDQNTTALLEEVKNLLNDIRFAEFPTYSLVKNWQSADGNFTDEDAQDMCEKLKGALERTWIPIYELSTTVDFTQS
ncbi:hypothetical protein ZTR_05035 [Talaromyces verruculosus]|nr:hypothetical protein ZTR_05035 [Talaromyces verruculosus]